MLLRRGGSPIYILNSRALTLWDLFSRKIRLAERCVSSLARMIQAVV